jgi:hypothetical protein
MIEGSERSFAAANIAAEQARAGDLDGALALVKLRGSGVGDRYPYRDSSLPPPSTSLVNPTTCQKSLFRPKNL